MDMTNEQIDTEFQRQAKLCSGIGIERQTEIVAAQFDRKPGSAPGWWHEIPPELDTKDLHPSVRHVLQFFTYKHLPEHLQLISASFATLAAALADNSDGNPELTVALRKLLEAKDAAVWGALIGEGT